MKRTEYQRMNDEFYRKEKLKREGSYCRDILKLNHTIISAKENFEILQNIATQDLGKRIHLIRKASGMTQMEVVEKLPKEHKKGGWGWHTTEKLNAILDVLCRDNVNP